MRRPTRPSNALPILLVVLLLGMSASATLYHDDRAELADDRPALETHPGLYFPGSQAGSVYSASTVQAGWLMTCAVLDNNEMRCWGSGTFGKLGTGDNIRAHHPREVLLGYQSGTPSLATEVGQGSGSSGHHTCALMIDSTLQCWGEDFLGQIGHGGSSGWHTTPYPVQMPLYKSAVQISNGGHHTCAIMEDDNTAEHTLSTAGAPTIMDRSGSCSPAENSPPS